MTDSTHDEGHVGITEIDGGEIHVDSVTLKVKIGNGFLQNLSIAAQVCRCGRVLVALISSRAATNRQGELVRP